jgi:hypothetical protein
MREWNGCHDRPAGSVACRKPRAVKAWARMVMGGIAIVFYVSIC